VHRCEPFWLVFFIEVTFTERSYNKQQQVKLCECRDLLLEHRSRMYSVAGGKWKRKVKNDWAISRMSYKLHCKQGWCKPKKRAQGPTVATEYIRRATHCTGVLTIV
jgi:hypothetical protein